MPVGYYFIVRVVNMFSGDWHVILRLPSILGYALTLLGVYWFVRRKLSATGSRLPDELLKSRLDELGAIAHHFPLRGSRQRYTQIAFKPFEAMKRKAAAVLHQRHHRRRGRIVFLRRRLRGLWP